MMAAKKLEQASITNNHLYPQYNAINPPAAGPIEKPKLMAKRTNETERVLFSGLLYAAIAFEFAGRNISAANA